MVYFVYPIIVVRSHRGLDIKFNLFIGDVVQAAKNVGSFWVDRGGVLRGRISGCVACVAGLAFEGKPAQQCGVHLWKMVE